MSALGGVLPKIEHAAPVAPAPELTFAASVGSLTAWLATAEPRGRAVYASGPDLPVETDGVRLARRWADEGKVLLFRERDPGDRARWRFLIVKRVDVPDALVPRPLDRARVTPKRGWREVEEGLLSRCEMRLRQLADKGEPCDSNTELAKWLGLPGGDKGRGRAKYLMHCLVTAGVIRIENHGLNQPRVVTILTRGRGFNKSTRSAL